MSTEDIVRNIKDFHKKYGISKLEFEKLLYNKTMESVSQYKNEDKCVPSDLYSITKMKLEEELIEKVLHPPIVGITHESKIFERSFTQPISGHEYIFTSAKSETPNDEDKTKYKNIKTKRFELSSHIENNKENDMNKIVQVETIVPKDSRYVSETEWFSDPDYISSDEYEYSF